MSTQAVAEATCQEIYREALDYFGKYARRQTYYGFSILQGPPLFQPPILFVGYQPGGAGDDGRRERDRGSEMKWPCTCNNATGNWPLSKKLQRMFQRRYLEQCVGMNAIFLRSPKTEIYKRDFDKVDRAKIEQFCLSKGHEIIEAINPLKIATIGFETGELFSSRWCIDLRNEEGENLTKIGEIAGRPAVAMRHLTGSRPPILNSDLDRIRDRVLAR